ncbi:hypothetical protein ABW20_dc0103968 [Dactylellina cionopaga]|nr:hypothetical protein ABW20_dc0103968 [Dactylellina cionopaga]
MVGPAYIDEGDENNHHVFEAYSSHASSSSNLSPGPAAVNPITASEPVGIVPPVPIVVAPTASTEPPATIPPVSFGPTGIASAHDEIAPVETNSLPGNQEGTPREGNKGLVFIIDEPEVEPALYRMPKARKLVNADNGPLGDGDSSASIPYQAGFALPTQPVLPKELNGKEVFSLIVNKMIGSGIVTGPAQVLLYTGRKDYALLIWALGFIYTIASAIMFVEFGYKFPVTGGELVYVSGYPV